jgi:hypothetical protein
VKESKRNEYINERQQRKGSQELTQIGEINEEDGERLQFERL